MNNLNEEKPTWDDIVKGIDFLFEEISMRIIGEVYENPDIIIGVGRGGALPAMMLSYKFNTPMQVVNPNQDYLTNDMASYYPNGLPKLKGVINSGTSTGISFPSILLVEDIVQTGKTLRTVYDTYAFEHNVVTCSIYTLEGAGYTPDVFWKSFSFSDQNTTIHLPTNKSLVWKNITL
jgi:hypoxanthine phosphoribosyltransferase